MRRDTLLGAAAHDATVALEGVVRSLKQEARRAAKASRTRWLISVTAALARASSCYYWRHQLVNDDVNQMSMFRAHKSEYENLLRMLQHDQRLAFINSGLTQPEDPSGQGISAQRVAEYRQEMSKLGVGAISYERSIGSALFLVDIMDASDILYFPIQTAALAKEYGLPLDSPPTQAHAIEGDWYLSSEAYR